MTFYARPGEPLHSHLEAVALRAKASLSIPTLPDQTHLAELAWICGATHDFGKYTSYFQNKLPPTKRAPPRKSYGNHAFLSALLGAFVARARYPERPLSALLVYLAIHRHHGHLVTPSEVLPQDRYLQDGPDFRRIERLELRLGSEELRAVQAQFNDIRQSPNLSHIVSEMKGLGIDETRFFLEQQDWWRLLGELRRVYDTTLKRQHDATAENRSYWQQLLLFSALIDADKHISTAASAGRTLEEQPRRPIPSSVVDDHIATLQASQKEFSQTRKRLQEIRDTVYQEATTTIEQRPIEAIYPAVLSLTAPTGSGKTLTAFGCALRLRERAAQGRGFLPRVIYTLPFVNIIDQNFNVAERVLSKLPDFTRHRSAYLLKHHHLAPLAFREDENRTNDESLLLTESWASEVIVTTFVQLLESLITNRNRALKKLHNVAGSIVVLDEVQSIPFEQWRLIEYVLTTLTEQLGCTVLQMTATRPHMLKTARELLDRPERHFRGLSRTIITPTGMRTFDDLENFILEHKNAQASMLIVLNTVSSTVELYRRLRDHFAPYAEVHRQRRTGKCPIMHLSTNITPWQRAYRVKLLRRYMKRGGKPLVIATQVVEAGVDLDFDIVIRDQGPLDAIVQAAGRCNRAGNAAEPRHVFIVTLERENGRLDAPLVYGNILPDITRRLLDGPIEEANLYDKLEAYFSELPERLSDDNFSLYIDAMRELRFEDKSGSSIHAYRHIKEQDQVPIIVEINEQARQTVEKLATLYQSGADRHAFREAYRELGPFIIAPARNRFVKRPVSAHDTIPEHYYIPAGDVFAESPAHYDLETGFKWEEEAIFF
jgi:CRISPR-associated endonuclease/helicase Cas3